MIETDGKEVEAFFAFSAYLLRIFGFLAIKNAFGA
jgi:hypothetical protein